MNKVAIKKPAIKKQNGKCFLSDEQLSENMSLIDTHRKFPKRFGGQYTDNNTVVVKPTAHMAEHGTLKKRDEKFDQLKTLIDAREQLRKLNNSSNNRLLAMKRRTDNLDERTIEFLNDQFKQTKSELGKIDRRIKKHLMSMSAQIIKPALKIRGLGAITVAYMLIYIDIEKARYASCLWSYTGLHVPSYERYKKNVAGGGNKILRTALYAMAESFIKSRNVYRDIYDSEKRKLEVSEKLTKSRNTQGKEIVCKWSETKKSHRHGAAIRKMIKHFLADVWKVWRTLEGFDTPCLYPESKLGHKGIIQPEERGWVY